MKIYYSEIEGLSPEDAAYPGVSTDKNSPFGSSLLACACRDYAKWYLPPKNSIIFGRSLRSRSDSLNYSVSHSRAHVLAGVAVHPLGVDTEPLDRKVSLRLAKAISAGNELSDFSVLELWCLKESFFKLKRGGDIRAMRFRREGGRIIGPEEGVYFRLYSDVRGAVVAACSPEDDLPDSLIHISPEKLLRKPFRWEPAP